MTRLAGCGMEYAAYFHDGSAATLEEAVEVMKGGGIPNEHRDEMLEEVPLSARDKEDLLSFLRALTVDSEVTKPRLP